MGIYEWKWEENGNTDCVPAQLYSERMMGDRHKSRKATIVLNMFITVVASRGA